MPYLTVASLLSESTSFILPANVWERDSNYSTGCFHITLTYVCGIKFTSEKILDCMKKYWEISVDTSENHNIVSWFARRIYLCIDLHMFTVKILQTSVVIQTTLYLSWTVKWGVAIIYFFQNPCTAALEKGWKVRGYEKNLHFVLAFFSTFSHLKNVVGKAFFKKFFQDIPLLEPVLSYHDKAGFAFSLICLAIESDESCIWYWRCVKNWPRE